MKDIWRARYKRFFNGGIIKWKYHINTTWADLQTTYGRNKIVFDFLKISQRSEDMVTSTCEKSIGYSHCLNYLKSMGKSHFDVINLTLQWPLTQHIIGQCDFGIPQHPNLYPCFVEQICLEDIYLPGKIAEGKIIGIIVSFRRQRFNIVVTTYSTISRFCF